jgi:outer membrane protein insertion porin family
LNKPSSILFNFAALAFLFFLYPKQGHSQNADEPATPIIWSVSFEGNESYSRIVLRDIIAARSPNLFRKLFRRYDEYRMSETELRRDRIRLIRYYERRGYDQIQVDVDISEGE